MPTVSKREPGTNTKPKRIAAYVDPFEERESRLEELGSVNEAMDGLVGVVLERLVPEVGEVGPLVDDRAGDVVRRSLGWQLRRYDRR